MKTWTLLLAVYLITLAISPITIRFLLNGMKKHRGRDEQFLNDAGRILSTFFKIPLVGTSLMLITYCVYMMDILQDKLPKKPVYSVKCDGCNKEFCDESGCSYETKDQQAVIKMAKMKGWHSKGECHYCPQCYHEGL